VRTTMVKVVVVIVGEGRFSRARWWWCYGLIWISKQMPRTAGSFRVVAQDGLDFFSFLGPA
jgi:hypothetical protein